MFGGDGSNSVFPTFLEDSRFQYVTGGLPQLQLFGDGQFFLELSFFTLLITRLNSLLLYFYCSKMFCCYLYISIGLSFYGLWSAPTIALLDGC